MEIHKFSTFTALLSVSVLIQLLDLFRVCLDPLDLVERLASPETE